MVKKLNLNKIHMEPQDLQKFIISIVLIGIVLVVGIYIADNIGTTLEEDVTTSGTNTNETLVSVDNVTATSFAILSTQPTASCSLTVVVNATGGETIASGNYTQPTSCTIIATAGSSYNGTNWNVTYGYSYTLATSTAASNAAEDVVDALATGTAWISILVIVGFAVIVLSMLTSGLGSAASTARTEYY